MGTLHWSQTSPPLRLSAQVRDTIRIWAIIGEFWGSQNSRGYKNFLMDNGYGVKGNSESKEEVNPGTPRRGECGLVGSVV